MTFKAPSDPSRSMILPCCRTWDQEPPGACPLHQPGTQQHPGDAGGTPRSTARAPHPLSPVAGSQRHRPTTASSQGSGGTPGSISTGQHPPGAKGRRPPPPCRAAGGGPREAGRGGPGMQRAGRAAGRGGSARRGGQGLRGRAGRTQLPLPPRSEPAPPRPAAPPPAPSPASPPAPLPLSSLPGPSCSPQPSPPLQSPPGRRSVRPSVRASVRGAGRNSPLPRDFAPPGVPGLGVAGPPWARCGGSPLLSAGTRMPSPGSTAPGRCPRPPAPPCPRRGRATSRSLGVCWPRIPSRHAAWLGEGSSKQAPKRCPHAAAGGSTRGPCDGWWQGCCAAAFRVGNEGTSSPPLCISKCPPSKLLAAPTAGASAAQALAQGGGRGPGPLFFGAHVSERPRWSGIPPPPPAAALQSVPTPVRMLHGPPGMAQSPASRGRSPGDGEPRGR